MYRIKVIEVCYFRCGNPAGYVLHGPAAKPWHNVMVAIGPFFLNTVSGCLIGFSSALRVKWGSGFDVLDLVLAWLGLSLAMHSFPSTGDASSIWQVVQSKETPLHTKIWAVPVVGLIYLGAIGSVVWLDALWGIAIIYWIPVSIIRLFA